MTRSESRPPRVLIAPLNWGLGHATRCIPIAREFERQGWEVGFAADGPAALILKDAFPDHRHWNLPGLEIHYPRSGSFIFSIATQVPAFLKRIRRERHDLEEILNAWEPQLVISDNRYGLHSDRCRSIFMTHQINILLPGMRLMESVVRSWVRNQILDFDELWLPDTDEEDSLAGELSALHDGLKGIPVARTGALSRFAGMTGSTESDEEQGHEFDNVFVVSGPEPVAEMFREQLRDQAAVLPGRSLLIKGQPELGTGLQVGKYELMEVGHLKSRDFARVLSKAKRVVGRSGYSSLMDWVVLQPKAELLLVPTPGQTEQEYLAQRWKEAGWAQTQSQSRLSLKDWDGNSADCSRLKWNSGSLAKLVRKETDRVF